MTILVIAEHNNQQLKPATLNTITVAAQLGAAITVLVAGFQCDSVVTAVAQIDQVNEVLVADAEAYQHGLAENLAALIVSIGKNYSHILAPATTFGKNFLPRVAALLDVGQISDVIEIIAQDTFVRPIYAGNLLATVQTSDPIKVLTIRTTAFDPAKKSDKKANIKKLTSVFADPKIKFVSQQLNQSDRPELTAARIVISGGRGLQTAENFQLLEKIADRLGAAVGASRAAVDAGLVPNDYQVGQTGKVVAPELYIAVGISGAIQHLAGMKDSKVIVAINKDPDAPIFQVADYGLVADLFPALAELEKELNN